ncbi:Protein kinase-like domain protein [Apiospora arundinis]
MCSSLRHPGSLSGDILRMRRNLPEISGHFEVEGDTIRKLDHPLEAPEPIEDHFDNIENLLECLPLLHTDPAKHFVKRGKYRSEIENLLKSQGGACPGKPKSGNLTRLLGKSPEGELVFEKLLTCQSALRGIPSLATIQRWLLDLTAPLSCLHSLGIIHRDLRLDNCLFSRDGGKRLVLCDLEGRWGQRSPPEIAKEGEADEAGWSVKSDVYCIADCIKGMVYCNAPPSSYVEWAVPAPLDAVVGACTQESPDDRPTLDELRSMVASLTETAV